MPKEDNSRPGTPPEPAAADAARFRDIFETSADIMFLVSGDGFILDANPAFSALTGLEWRPPGKLRAEELVREDQRQGFMAAMAGARAGGAPARFRTVFVSAGGGSFEAEGAIYPQRAAAGPAYIQGVFRGVSQELTAPAEACKLRKMAALGRLAGVVAHDFNNMLGAIEGYASLGMRTLAETDQLWSDLNEIRRAVAKAAALTGQLLLFSRTQVVQRGAVSISEIMEGLQKMLGGLLGEGISLEVSVPPGLPPLNGDAGQLEQVLVNLVLNARDAMPGGGVIRLKAEAVPAAQANPPPYARLPAATGFLCFSVSDSGRGMPPEVLEHVFEPFFTTKEKGKGTGLGLSTAYGIVKRHNGWIDVKSGPGGSEFSVFLPAGA